MSRCAAVTRMQSNANGPLILSREELYEQVWSTPMVRLAKEYGLSDVGLAKICKKHQIPRPRVGYWAKVQLGRKVSRPPLPPLGKGASHRFWIRQRTPDENERFRPEIREAVVAEDREEHRIQVLAELVDPRPLVQKTARSLRKAKQGEDGLVRPRAKQALNVVVSPESVDRAMRIMDALVRGLEQRSHRVVILNEEERVGTFAEIEGEHVEFWLKEVVDRKEREPTPKERRAKERHPWFYRTPFYRYEPTSRLFLQIVTHQYDGHRRRWSDGKRQRLETCLNPFVASILRIADGLAADRQRREEECERREAWERERAIKVPLIRQEEQCLKGLQEEANAWHASQSIRQYVQAVTESATAGSEEIKDGSELHRWIIWATEQADRLDPLTESPPSILDEKQKYGYSSW